MMDPPPALRIAGMACLVPKNAPLTLTAMVSSHSSALVSSIFFLEEDTGVIDENV